MARRARVISETNIYHIVVKGADRQLLFLEDQDYRKYLQILEFCKEECGFELYTFILMSNHVHLLIRVKDIPLSTIFRKLNTRYAMWFNGKYQRTGFLQQGRFHSTPVTNAAQFIRTVCYIHYNAVKAGLESKCGESYKWSSFSEIKSRVWHLVDGTVVERIFGDMESFQKMHDAFDYKNEKCMDIDNMRIRIPDDVAREIIFDLSKCNSPKEFQELSMCDQHRYIAMARKKGLSIRQLNRLTGISKGIIERIPIE